MAKARVKAPKKASKGEVFEVKTLISHDMETGRRKDKEGNVIPRKIINNFACLYNGKEVFSVDLQPSVSANPFISFYVRAEESGELSFVWTEDGGEKITKTSEISVS